MCRSRRSSRDGTSAGPQRRSSTSEGRISLPPKKEALSTSQSTMLPSRGHQKVGLKVKIGA